MAGKLSLLLLSESWPSLNMAPSSILFKIFPAGIVPWGPIRGRELVRPLFEEEAEMLISLWVIGASLWIPTGNA